MKDSKAERPKAPLSHVDAWHAYFIQDSWGFLRAVWVVEEHVRRATLSLREDSLAQNFPLRIVPLIDAIVLAVDRHPRLRIDPTPIAMLKFLAFGYGGEAVRVDHSQLPTIRQADQALQRLVHWLDVEMDGHSVRSRLTEAERVSKEIVDANPGVTEDQIRRLALAQGVDISSPRDLFRGPTKKRGPRRLWELGYRSRGRGHAGFYPPGR